MRISTIKVIAERDGDLQEVRTTKLLYTLNELKRKGWTVRYIESADIHPRMLDTQTFRDRIR